MVSKNVNIHLELAKKYNLDPAVISVICNHPFVFASRKISDANDEKTLMFAYLGKIKIKNRLKGKKNEINKAKDRDPGRVKWDRRFKENRTSSENVL